LGGRGGHDQGHDGLCHDPRHQDRVGDAIDRNAENGLACNLLDRFLGCSSARFDEEQFKWQLRDALIPAQRGSRS
jgi:hypothetical protein